MGESHRESHPPPDVSSVVTWWKTEDERVGKVGCFPFRSHFLLLPVCPVGKPAGLETPVPFLPESTQTSLARGALWAEARLSVALTSLPPVLSHSQGPPHGCTCWHCLDSWYVS